MLLGSCRPYHWLILEEKGRKTHDDDEDDDDDDDELNWIKIITRIIFRTKIIKPLKIYLVNNTF